VAWELLIHGTANGTCLLHLIDSDAVKGLGKLLDDWVYHFILLWNLGRLQIARLWQGHIGEMGVYRSSKLTWGKVAGGTCEFSSVFQT
jgi:hypothetical protein